MSNIYQSCSNIKIECLGKELDKLPDCPGCIFHKACVEKTAWNKEFVREMKAKKASDKIDEEIDYHPPY